MADELQTAVEPTVEVDNQTQEPDVNFHDIFGVDDTAPINEFGDPVEPEPTPEPEPEPEPEPTPAPQPEVEPEPAPEPEKPVQSAEDNARFAEQRRQQQVEERARQMAEEMRKQDPAYQAMQLLQKQSGLPADQIYQNLQQQAMQREAEQRGVPIEVLQEMNTLRQKQQELEQQNQALAYSSWVASMQAQQAELQKQYDFLTPDDFTQATQFMLQNMAGANVQLNQVVHMLHGEKIAENLREKVRQEILAEQSGRKQSPLPPQGKGSPVTADKPTLTAAEKQVAKALGISEEDYLANKR